MTPEKPKRAASNRGHNSTRDESTKFAADKGNERNFGRFSGGEVWRREGPAGRENHPVSTRETSTHASRAGRIWVSSLAFGSFVAVNSCMSLAMPVV